MPDFLTRLAERTLGFAEAVQPRIAPLFGSGADLAAEEPVEESAADVLAPQREEPTPLVEQAHPRVVSESMPAAAIGVNELPAEEPRQAPSVQAAARIPGGAARDAVSVPAARQDEPPLLLPRRAAPESVAHLATPAAAMPPDVNTPVESRSLRGHPREEKNVGPPTVRVTIGRVEVRAVFPAPEVRRPTPATPRPGLTLDDYLKQRREGTR
jgi:hypothetical protein